jgi:transcription elongation factor Elf1
MQTEHFFTCPYCWQQISVLIEAYSEEQQWVEDCEVCCRPIRFRALFSSLEVEYFEAEGDLD